MASKKDVNEMYDTILAFPLMNQQIKVGMRISRRNILLLSMVIEYGLVSPDRDRANEIFGMIPEDAKKELSALAKEFLSKAELGPLPEKQQA